jgi:hypothetical protein
VQIVLKILAQKTLHKNRAGGVSQGEGPEFKPQYHKKKKKKKCGKRGKGRSLPIEEGIFILLA